jgi:hypothetical protein
MTNKDLQSRVRELESLLNMTTELLALFTDGASFEGSFVEKVAFNTMAEDSQARDLLIERSRAVLKGGA